MYSIWDLSQVVAKHLAGRPVILRPQRPIYAGDLATTQKDQAGNIVIDIPPDLGGQFLRVLLHEVAHARKHAPGFVRSNTDRPSGSITESAPSPARKAARARMEAEAEALTKTWLEFADRQAVKVLRSEPGLSELESKLWALAQWKG